MNNEKNKKTLPKFQFWQSLSLVIYNL